MSIPIRVLLPVGLFFLTCVPLVSDYPLAPGGRQPSRRDLPPKETVVGLPPIEKRKAQPTAAPGKQIANVADHYGKLPLSFEANDGQTDRRVKFLARGNGYSLFLTGKEAVIALRKAVPQPEGKNGMPGRQRVEPQKEEGAGGTVVRMELVGANAAPRVAGAEELPGKVNYFIGNDPAKWRTNVPTFAKVKYEGVYTGVDLVYYGNQGQLEYDFVVAPGVDPNQIRLKFAGAGKLRVDQEGSVVLGSTGEEVRFEKPVVYQEVAGKRKPVEGTYAVASANLIGIRLGKYDRSHPLVIDPTFSYSTYLGGSYADGGEAIAVDSSGNAYVTGFTASTNFPTADALQPTLAGNTNAFVTKLNATGTALVYSTYLGGSNTDGGNGIAVDVSGNTYVTGQTNSTDFPTANALQPTLAGNIDAFVTKINATGAGLVYSTYLGGSSGDYVLGIAVDLSGDAYVTGYTNSTNFPTANALQPTLAGNTNAFVTEINATGAGLVYSTYLGGSGVDYALGIAVDASGNTYVSGYTESTNFPTANALQRTLAGAVGAFVTKINPGGAGLVYSTYLGGSNADYGSGIALDASGDVYVTGFANSTNFPTANALQPALAGHINAFVTKINASGAALVYSTYLGGSNLDYGDAIAVDISGNAYVTGRTSSTNFPTANALQPTLAGNTNAFVTEINASGAALVSSTYLGGSYADSGNGIAVDASGNTYVSGYTESTNFPTANALQATLRGNYNAFITKISPTVVGDFIGSFDTFNQSVAPGGSAVYNLTLTPLEGFTGNVFLSASNLPAGTTVSFAPQTVIGGSGTSAITVQTSPSTPRGSYNITVTGTYGTTVHSTSITLDVVANGDFIGSFNQFSATATPSTPASYVLTLTPLQGFTENVNLSVSGVPYGATGTFSAPVVAGGNGSSTLTVSVASDTPSGTYPLTITGTAPGGFSHSTTINLVAQAQVGDFSGTFNRSVTSVSIGSSTTYVLTLTPSGGFSGNVALSASGVPLNATATFSPAIVNGGSGSSTLTISTASTTPAGNRQITVTGTSGLLVHSTVLTLLVGTVDFTGTVTPTSQTVTAGSSAQYTIQLTTLGTMPFGNLVTLSISGLPSGVTASFSSLTINPDLSGTSVLTLTTSASTPAGSYAPTLTATGGGVTHAGAVGLVVQ
jgi:hypothetical protein